MATVKHVENADGSQSLGVVVDKKFVPFVTVPAEEYTRRLAEANADDETDDGKTKGGEK